MPTSKEAHQATPVAEAQPKANVDKRPVAKTDGDAPSTDQEESEREDSGSAESDADRAKEKEREMEESGEELPG